MTDGQLTTLEGSNLSPTEVTRAALARLPQPVTSWLRWAEHREEPGIMGELHPIPPEPTGKDLAEAIITLEACCQPPDPETMIQLLTRLRWRTVGQSLSEDDMTGQLAIYIEDLSEYPADVVATVLEEHGKRNKWWPSVAELVERAEFLAARRLGKLRRLQRLHGRLPDRNADGTRRYEPRG